jgi:hypothetical protein
MDANLRPQILFEKKDGRDQLLGLIQPNNSQIVPENGLLIRTSSLQVFPIYKLNLQVHLSIFISVRMSLFSNFNSKII